MSDLLGQQLGQYTIVDLIGRGGMATVYRARQTSMDRDVAIKVIKPDLTESGEFIERFKREARVVASLSHAHILKVFDYGQQGRLVYLVMELLKGGSLADLIRRGALPPKRAERLLEQIASALDYAHSRGIVHRDLKTANVLLDDSGSAFLTDFGIAKLLRETTRLTQTGLAIGTPAYMSPEQWQGLPLDGRADVYALGIMLYEMLSGKLPFDADTPFTLMHKHVNETPPALREARTDLPLGIDTVIGIALAKNRENRYSTAGEMAEAFSRALAGKGPGPATVIGMEADDSTAALVAVPDLVTSGTGSRGTGARGNTGGEGSRASNLASGPVSAGGVPAAARTSSRRGGLLVGGLLVLILLLGGGGALLLTNRPTETPTPTTAVASDPTETTATDAAGANPVPTDTTPTLAPTDAPSDTPRPTFTPTDASTPTETLRPEVLAGLTLTQRVTETANAIASFTRTPTVPPTETPSPTETPDSVLTIAAIVAEQETAMAITLTANAVASFTSTPTITPTFTPSETETPTEPPTETPSHTPTYTPTERPSPTDPPTPTRAITATFTATATSAVLPTEPPNSLTQIAEVQLTAFAGQTVVAERATETALRDATGGSERRFGPRRGQLRHNADDTSTVAFSSSVRLRDFVASVRFYNPYNRSRGTWDYAIFFRETDANSQYRLIVRANNAWSLELADNPDSATWKTVQSGTLTNLNRTVSGSNTIRLIAVGDYGLFFLNDTFIAQLDLSAKQTDGVIKLVTGAYSGAEINGEVTRYDNFAIWTARPIFGPEAEELIHVEAENKVTWRQTNVSVSNFIAEARFYNPYDRSRQKWDYAFFFRNVDGGSFRLIVTSDSRYELFYQSQAAQDRIISGNLSRFDTSANGSNVLRLLAIGRRGFLFVNDQLVGQLDLSREMQAGNFQIVTGAFTGYSIPGEGTRYEDFVIIELPDLEREP